VYGHQPVSARPAKDPERTPTPATPAMREKEAQRARERPQGEVLAGTSTRRVTAKEAEEIKRRENARGAGDQRRLGFGTIRR
jgi:hypothetical protein